MSATPARAARQDVKPCDCAAYPFPHRRDNWCRIEEDGNDRDDHDDERELRDADNTARARDCNAERNLGRWA